MIVRARETITAGVVTVIMTNDHVNDDDKRDNER